ncbi:serine/arginine-rich splicing factor 5 isoform X2 [Hydra vulgaris]|uniref:Serine/arginine-rich splicing factor 5 isoform X4 n=1 Tax=Hydra vulgaris TaxID=6087 RepID=A0ABM4BM00_HYDVU
MSDYRERRDRYSDPRPPLPSKSMMGARIYIGKLPGDIRERDIDKAFSKFGHVREIAMKGNYCFLQYEKTREAEDAVYEMHDRSFFGERIQVEHARQPKEFGFRAPSRFGGSRGYGGYSRSSTYSSRDYSRRRSPPQRSDYRLSVTNLSTRCDAQDLKAVMQKAGDVVFSDAHRRRVGEGVVEFASRKDMERALKKLDGLEINGKPIKLKVEEARNAHKSRSRSRSESGSRSRSKSESGSPSRKRRRHSSRSGSDDASDREENERTSAKVDEKAASDDEEFEEAERNVKRKKEQRKEANGDKGSGSESDGPEELSKDEAENDDDEDTEIVEEIVEEEIEVEEEVTQSNDEEDETEVESKKHEEPKEDNLDELTEPVQRNRESGSESPECEENNE